MLSITGVAVVLSRGLSVTTGNAAVGCFCVDCFVGLSGCFVGLPTTGFAELDEPPCSVVALLACEAKGFEGIVGDTNFGDVVGVVREDELDDVVGDTVSLTVDGEEAIGAIDGDFVVDDKDDKEVSISIAGDFIGGCVIFTDGLVVGTEVGLEVVTSRLLEGASIVSSMGDPIGFGVNGCNVGVSVISTRKDPSSLDAASSPPFVEASVVVLTMSGVVVGFS